MIEPTGRGVLDTRLRGYDDFVRGGHLHVTACDKREAFAQESGSDEAIHASASREVDCFASLAMTGTGRIAPDTPVCVGYDDLFATRKILEAGSVLGASPMPVTPM